MITRFSHVGFAVKDIEAAIKLYEDLLGFKLWRHGIVNHPAEGMKNCKLSVGNTDIDVELLQPTDPNGFIGKSVARRGEGIYHLCFVTDNLDAEIKRLKAKGVQVMEREPSATLPARGAWIHPRSTTGVLIELVEKPTK